MRKPEATLARKKLPEKTQGKNLKKNQNQKATCPLLGNETYSTSQKFPLDAMNLNLNLIIVGLVNQCFFLNEVVLNRTKKILLDLQKISDFLFK